MTTADIPDQRMRPPGLSTRRFHTYQASTPERLPVPVSRVLLWEPRFHGRAHDTSVKPSIRKKRNSRAQDASRSVELSGHGGGRQASDGLVFRLAQLVRVNEDPVEPDPDPAQNAACVQSEQLRNINNADGPEGCCDGNLFGEHTGGSLCFHSL
jgi:hypothetical protein